MFIGFITVLAKELNYRKIIWFNAKIVQKSVQRNNWKMRKSLKLMWKLYVKKSDELYVHHFFCIKHDDLDLQIYTFISKLTLKYLSLYDNSILFY